MDYMSKVRNKLEEAKVNLKASVREFDILKYKHEIDYLKCLISSGEPNFDSFEEHYEVMIAINEAEQFELDYPTLTKGVFNEVELEKYKNDLIYAF